MRSYYHVSIAKLTSERGGGALPFDDLRSGSLAPDEGYQGYTFPKPHHLNPDLERLVREYVLRARQAFISNRNALSAFLLGVALHYLADSCVPYSGTEEEHSLLEGRIGRQAVATLKQTSAARLEGRSAVEAAIRDFCSRFLRGDFEGIVEEFCRLALSLAAAVSGERLEPSVAERLKNVEKRYALEVEKERERLGSVVGFLSVEVSLVDLRRLPCWLRPYGTVRRGILRLRLLRAGRRWCRSSPSAESRNELRREVATIQGHVDESWYEIPRWFEESPKADAPCPPAVSAQATSMGQRALRCPGFYLRASRRDRLAFPSAGAASIAIGLLAGRFVGHFLNAGTVFLGLAGGGFFVACMELELRRALARAIHG